MINEIREDVAALWSGMIGPGQMLEGIKKVQPHDESLLSDYLPGITFEYAGESELTQVKNRWEFKLRFKATLYSAGFESRDKAITDHLNLLCRMQAGKLRGMQAAAYYVAHNGYKNDDDKKFRVALDPATRSFGVKGKGNFQQHWTIRTELFMDFETWLDRSEVITMIS